VTSAASSVGSPSNGAGAAARPHRRWLLFIDVALLGLLGVLVTLEDASQLFKLAFVLLTLGAFTWNVDTFVLRATFWTMLTSVVLVGLVAVDRVPLLELLDLPFFVAILVLVYVVSSRRDNAMGQLNELLAQEQQQVSDLESVAEIKADFTAMVVHEIGNPLAALRRLTEMMRFDTLDAEVRSGLLDSMTTEVSTLETLVADVQATVAVERDGFRVDLRPIPLRDLFYEVASYGDSVSGSHSFRTEYVEALDGGYVLADPERIGQVLRNLLSNAVKYSPGGSPIVLRATAGAAHRVRIEVEDQGRGITADDLRRVFEKYGRGRSGSAGVAAPGVGLGLYISQRLVQSHGSELTVRSEPGRGSVFGFDLLLAEVPE